MCSEPVKEPIEGREPVLWKTLLDGKGLEVSVRMLALQSRLTPIRRLAIDGGDVIFSPSDHWVGRREPAFKRLLARRRDREITLPYQPRSTFNRPSEQQFG